MAENVHKHHRQRVKDKFLAHGLASFCEHELLEILLFYCIPNGDTNNLAHQLIQHFGSLKAVMAADYDQLRNFPGLGNHSASFITFLRMFSIEYHKLTHKDSLKLNNVEETKEFCIGLFTNVKKEQLLLVGLDNTLTVKDVHILSEGTTGVVEVNMRRLAELVIQKNYGSVLITHNHPDGICLPSRADRDTTVSMVQHLTALGVRLVDHVVVGNDGAYSMRERDIVSGIWS